VHAAFVRSPHAHAKILSINTADAVAAKGVVAVYSGDDLAQHVTPYVGTLTHLAGLRSAPQYPMAVGVARWQGEPVVMVIAASRAAAEDACDLVDVDYQELPAVIDCETALDGDAPVIHPEFNSNLAWERTVVAGDIDAAFAAPGVQIVEREFRFGRHTGVTLETRGTVCDYDPAEQHLTVHYSGQAPHMMQVIFSRLMDLPEENIRVISNDVGGSFGIKIHTYGDEMATAVAAKLRSVRKLCQRHSRPRPRDQRPDGCHCRGDNRWH
jgi:aerobic carbon-monoxide dehydrogenase large subunit